MCDSKSEGPEGIATRLGLLAHKARETCSSDSHERSARRSSRRGRECVAEALGNGGDRETVVSPRLLGKPEEREENKRADDRTPMGNREALEYYGVRFPDERGYLINAVEPPGGYAGFGGVTVEEICSNRNGAEDFDTSETHEPEVDIRVQTVVADGKKFLDLKAPLPECTDAQDWIRRSSIH
jgi:hypothetical protein